MHDDALVELHWRIELPAINRVVLEADIDTIGLGDSEELFPPPPQEIKKKKEK